MTTETQGAGGAGARDLTEPMINVLYALAQHKFGWKYVADNERQVAAALIEAGLVEGIGDPLEKLALTLAGIEQVKQRWPVSPVVLESYDHGGRGWTPREGGAAAPVTSGGGNPC